MLQIKANQVMGFSVTGNIGADFYAQFVPLTHDSGAAWWVIDEVNGQPFTDSDGQTYRLRRKSEGELETPAYLAAQRAARVLAWNQGVNQFIIRFFDLGEQQSFAAIFADLVDQQQTRPLSADELAVKTALKAVKGWIEGVMAYYYAIKTQLESAANMAELQAIGGDFESRFGVQGTILPAPPVTLRQFFG